MTHPILRAGPYPFWRARGLAEVWRRGSVVGSWLLDLTAAALQESPDLAAFAVRPTGVRSMRE